MRLGATLILDHIFSDGPSALAVCFCGRSMVSSQGGLGLFGAPRVSSIPDTIEENDKAEASGSGSTHTGAGSGNSSASHTSA